MTQAAVDRFFMKRALRLAAKGVGTTHPNPMVGAVLVSGGSVIGEGWHELPGKPHAEVLSIDRAGRRAAGATMYVNLEPCSHYGRTPPCTDRIIQAGISRLVAGCRDPNPDVNGKGFETLERAGIEVSEGLLDEEARELNRAFFHYVANGIPYVTLKTAMSLDGRIATSSGESRWITGKGSRRAAHRLR
ncbi:MAG TPA: bifunctional diaminohydroxyphosphoribosylaminopyrimidine deaminase/5-amino-6-(5-phosphoribosylamino)uracil reductase RibD, partial [Proteobacteria bacterium]|nr:bifunctional diaminohydroxyphosphoribosylaminopyrimidine deaminase/5-amino-6-(5-phosphoribosylamino)uracil reductase RibD [Pseudomonadota bacterium]